MTFSLMEGNEAVAWGAVAAGCDFFAGYPITPATTIYNHMLQLLPSRGGICMQGEDEIASFGFCLGASMAGRKVMTATSGPGISLYSEQISFAIGSEIPIVIVNVQRLGPSTGSATRGADGDIQFMRWGNSGGLPVIVLAPTDARDCYTLTIAAFNLAETYRCPVFLASNKEIAMTRESIDLDSLTVPDIVDRRYAPTHHDTPFDPFKTDSGHPTPAFLPIGGKRLVRQTSSTHGADGYITTDPDEINRFQERLQQKVTGAVDQYSWFEADPVDRAESLVICYGVTARAAKVAVAQARQEGRRVALLVLKTLWPIPADVIAQQAADVPRVLVPEMNLGQYSREIERVLPGKAVRSLGHMNGNLLTPEKIMEALTHA
jgi:2-oxoglutarate ferredoxin oxidoreductase subunit alpha